MESTVRGGGEGGRSFSILLPLLPVFPVTFSRGQGFPTLCVSRAKMYCGICKDFFYVGDSLSSSTLARRGNSPTFPLFLARAPVYRATYLCRVVSQVEKGREGGGSFVFGFSSVGEEHAPTFCLGGHTFLRREPFLFRPEEGGSYRCMVGGYSLQQE